MFKIFFVYSFKLPNTLYKFNKSVLWQHHFEKLFQIVYTIVPNNAPLLILLMQFFRVNHFCKMYLQRKKYEMMRQNFFHTLGQFDLQNWRSCSKKPQFCKKLPKYATPTKPLICSPSTYPAIILLQRDVLSPSSYLDFNMDKDQSRDSSGILSNLNQKHEKVL